MTVLILADRAEGGLHPIFARLAVHIAKRVRTVIVTTGRNADVDTLGRLTEAAADIEYVGRPPGAIQLSRILQRHSIDVVHCQCFRQLVTSWAATQLCSREVSLVFTDRNSLGWRTRTATWVRSGCLRIARPAVSALTELQTTYIKSLPGLHHVEHIPNGVDATLFAGPSDRRRHASDPVTLICPARLDRLKGHLDLFDICSRLIGMGHRPKLVLAGDGPERWAYASRVKELGLEGAVRFAGQLATEQLASELRAAHIGVFPTYFEMMPNAVLEMMASGLPVIAYGAGAIPELIEDGICGYIVRIGDVVGFQKRLEHLIENPNAAQDLGDRAATVVKQKFAIEGIAERTLALYERCVRDRGRLLAHRSVYTTR